MNRKVIKPVVLSGLFLAALIVFSIITNQDNKDMTTAMKEATLPIVQFYEGNNSVAQLHGYVSEMNITKMRDGIVPVDHTRLLPLKINTYGQKIRGIAYEIRSLDDSRLVAKGDAQGIKEKNNEISANLKIQNILGKGEEYELIVILASGKNKIRYYTRLMQTQTMILRHVWILHCSFMNIHSGMMQINLFRNIWMRQQAIPARSIMWI